MKLSKLHQKHLAKMLNAYTPEDLKTVFPYSQTLLKKAANGQEIGKRTKKFLRETLLEFSEPVIGHNVGDLINPLGEINGN